MVCGNYALVVTCSFNWLEVRLLFTGGHSSLLAFVQGNSAFLIQLFKLFEFCILLFLFSVMTDFLYILTAGANWLQSVHVQHLSYGVCWLTFRLCNTKDALWLYVSCFRGSSNCKKSLLSVAQHCFMAFTNRTVAYGFHHVLGVMAFNDQIPHISNLSALKDTYKVFLSMKHQFVDWMFNAIYVYAEIRTWMQCAIFG